jgi:hypothetical protein
MKTRLFEWLVEYHCSKNLEQCLRYVRDGKVVSPIKGKVLREGRDENEIYNGILIIANGTTLVDKLIHDGLAESANMDESPTRIQARDDFVEYVSNQEGCDGAFIFDGTNHTMRRVYEIKNNTNYKAGDLLANLPSDFVFYNGAVLNLANIGTKTRLAISLPHAYDVHTFQIKRSAYTPLGIGKVTHFNKNGLAEEFFFRYDPQSQGPFVNEEHKIIGVYRKYERTDGKLVRTKAGLYVPQKELVLA